VFVVKNVFEKFAIARNTPLPYVVDDHCTDAGKVVKVQVMPSVDEAAVVDPAETATNF